MHLSKKQASKPEEIIIYKKQCCPQKFKNSLVRVTISGKNKL